MSALLTPQPYTREELDGYLAANGGRFGGWGLDTERWYATVDATRAALAEMADKRIHETQHLLDCCAQRDRALAASTAREAQMAELLRRGRFILGNGEWADSVDAALALAPQSQEPLRALLERAATAGWNEGVNRRPVLSSVAAIVSALLPPVGSGGESEGGSR